MKAIITPNNQTIVSCRTCKYLIALEDAHLHVPALKNREEYYCSAHKQPYDEVILYAGTMNNPPKKTQYFKRMEVDESGEPLGYTKKYPAGVSFGKDGDGINPPLS